VVFASLRQSVSQSWNIPTKLTVNIKDGEMLALISILFQIMNSQII
jgi:hypothetical protein